MDTSTLQTRKTTVWTTRDRTLTDFLIVNFYRFDLLQLTLYNIDLGKIDFLQSYLKQMRNVLIFTRLFFKFFASLVNKNWRILRLFWNPVDKIRFLEIVFRVEFSDFWKSSFLSNFKKSTKSTVLFMAYAKRSDFFVRLIFLVFWRLLFYPSEEFRKCRKFHE